MEKESPWIRALLTPGKAAKRNGVTVSILHFYESKGLTSSMRNSGNQRRYRRNVLHYIVIIRIAQRIGIPPAVIGDTLGASSEGHSLSTKEWRQLSSQWRKELDRHIHTLVALRNELGGCIGCGCLSHNDCPSHNLSDQFGGQGTGARPLGDD